MYRGLHLGHAKYSSYFVNEHDEIRNIENPKAYFKFFLTKNDRHNCVQREAMNGERKSSLGSPDLT